MNALISVLPLVPVWLVTAGQTVLWVLRAWSSRLGARSRSMLLTSGVDTVALLALTRALAPPPGPSSWAWVLACGAAGVALAGAVLRWSALPTLAPGRDGKPARHGPLWIVLVTLHTVVGLGVVAIVA